MRAPVTLALLLVPGLTFGQEGERPSEDELFGGASSPPAPPAGAAAPSEAELFGAPAEVGGGEDSDAGRDAAILGAANLELSQDASPDDPLTIGGQFYLRYLTSVTEQVPVDDTAEAEGESTDASAADQVSVSLPALLDVYLDARPGDRVRAYASFRVQDNALPPPSFFEEFVASLPESYQAAFESTETSTATQLYMTQLWTRFDLGRKVYVTAGKQMVKWGTARFWNPTDFLQPVRRDPLEPFDVRGGVNLLKLHVPWEATGWNFYALAIMDETMVPVPMDEQLAYLNYEPDEEDGGLNPTSYDAPTVPEPEIGDPRNIGGAARAEIVFGTVEVGIDGLLQKDRRPRLGVDFSAGVGLIDLYGEVAIKKGSDAPLWREVDPEADTGSEQYEAYEPEGFTPAAAAGLNYQRVLGDNDSLILGLEYSYNTNGYDDPNIYPWLLLSGSYTPFYLGKHYGSAYAVLSGPGRFDDSSLTLSTLANLSDRSWLTRLDVSTLVHTHLRVEAYGALHTGTRGGEFRLAGDVPLSLIIPGSEEVYVQPAPVLDAGVSLRLNL